MKDGQIRLRISRPDLEAIQAKARRLGIGLSELTRRLLRAWLRGDVGTPEDGEND